EKCVFYGCSRSSDHCELDHATGWAEGGTTNVANLRPECKKHHRLKTETDWELDQPNRHQSDWTSPAGLEYPTTPEPLAHTPPGELANILEQHQIHDINTKLTAYQRKHEKTTGQAGDNGSQDRPNINPQRLRLPKAPPPEPELDSHRDDDDTSDETPPPF
ncbi:hypothetical protein D477_020788, partial [Arthrobacter crystallopoietes BAB-32]